MINKVIMNNKLAINAIILSKIINNREIQLIWLTINMKKIKNLIKNYFYILNNLQNNLNKLKTNWMNTINF